MRRLALAALLACHAAPAAPRPAPPAASAPAPDPSIDDRLAKLAVTDDDFYRPVLYSWTTPDQIAGLRASRVLLTATAIGGGFVSPYVRALTRVHARGGPGRDLARVLLSDPRLARRRYAWPAPFATVLGLGARSYGNALIRIELLPQAWIGRFDPEAPDPFAFVDAAGASIDSADVVAHPERIGAIYHVRTEPTLPARFREYVVCNPAMVASWSVATPEIRAELVAELAIVRDLGSRVWEASELAESAARAWSGTPAATTTVARWHAALAFDNAKYRPSRRSFEALADALAAYDAAGEPLAVP